VLLLILVGVLVKKKWRMRLWVPAFIMLVVFSNGAFFNVVSRAWEVTIVEAQSLDEEFHTAVVLGGMASENMYNGLPRFAQSSDRLWHGLWLLNKGYVDTLIISGGLGNLFDKQKPEGELLKTYLSDVGLMQERILIESLSRNTYENALNSKKLFDREGLQKEIVLVTSAFHMRRARACFIKQGFDVEAFSADPLASIRPLHWKDYFVPSAEILSQWGIVFKEWMGMIMYKMNGYL
jgi:uncharacterized SAM-binding protein YcdF (DUF218 family)